MLERDRKLPARESTHAARIRIQNVTANAQKYPYDSLTNHEVSRKAGASVPSGLTTCYCLVQTPSHIAGVTHLRRRAGALQANATQKAAMVNSTSDDETVARASQQTRKPLGILMLDTRFPRIHGDLGNAATWNFDVLYNVVRGARASNVVSPNNIADIEPFINSALELESCGVAGITTSCGFLSLTQRRISERLSVPFAASSLLQIPVLETLIGPAKRVGILTIDSRALTARHLAAAHVALDTPIGGTENGEVFTRGILSDSPTLDVDACRRDNVQAAVELVDRHPQVGAIVLECTNMVPYAGAIRVATGRPVYSVYTFINWFYSGLHPDEFGQAQ
ncbi:MAG: aspartate/glutamate racemase family protein [Granulosicoccus sp.]